MSDDVCATYATTQLNKVIVIEIPLRYYPKK